MRSMLALIAVILLSATAHAGPPACDAENVVQVLLNVVRATQVQTAPRELGSRSTTAQWCTVTLYTPDPFSGAFWLVVYTVEWVNEAERRVRAQTKSVRRCMPYKGPGSVTGPGGLDGRVARGPRSALPHLLVSGVCLRAASRRRRGGRA